MIGKVREDISLIFRVLNLSNDISYAIILAVQTFIVIVLIFIITLNFGAVLKYQVDIPLAQLTQFLLQNCNENQKISSAAANRNLDKLKKTVQSEITTKHMISEQQKMKIKHNKSNNDNQESHLNLQISSDQVNLNSLTLTAMDMSNNGKKNRKLSNNLLLIPKYNCSQIKSPRQMQLTNDKKNTFDSYITLAANADKSENIDIQTGQFLSVNKNIQFFNDSQNLSFGKGKSEIHIPIQSFAKNLSRATDQMIQSLSRSPFNQNYKSNLTMNRQVYENKINIQKDIEPMFQEMQVIKDTFHQLGSVIAYKQKDIQQNQQINSSNQGDTDYSSQILHYSFATKIFKQLKNNYGVSLSRINLGYFYQKKGDYIEALYHYEAALFCSLLELGCDSLSQFIQLYQNGIFNVSIAQDNVKEQFIIICVCHVLQAHAIKEIIIDRTDLNQPKKVRKHFFKKGNKKRWLERAIELLGIVRELFSKLSKLGMKVLSDEIYVFIEVENLEILIELEQTNCIESKLEELIQLFEILSKNFQLDQLMNTSNIHQNNQQTFNKFYIQESNNEVIFSMIEAHISYLLGLVSLKKQNYKVACEQFSKSLEQPRNLDLNVQKKCLHQIRNILSQNNICLQSIDQSISLLNYRCCQKVYDIAILIEAQIGCNFTSTHKITQLLLNMHQSFISPHDRITFIIFQNSKSRVIQPLSVIDKFKQWLFCIESIPIVSLQLKEEIDYINQDKPKQFNHDIYIPNNITIRNYQQRFVQLQQQQIKNQSQNNQIIRSTLFFIFSSPESAENNSDISIKAIITQLQQQFSSSPQIIIFKKEHKIDHLLLGKTLKAIENNERIIKISDIEQFNYFCDYHKRSDTSKYFLTNMILTSSNL